MPRPAFKARRGEDLQVTEIHQADQLHRIRHYASLGHYGFIVLIDNPGGRAGDERADFHSRFPYLAKYAGAEKAPELSVKHRSFIDIDPAAIVVAASTKRTGLFWFLHHHDPFTFC